MIGYNGLRIFCLDATISAKMMYYIVLQKCICIKINGYSVFKLQK